MKPRHKGLVRDVHTVALAMGNKRRRSERAGFSLIEAMISAAILGLALMGLVRLHKTSMQGTVRAAATGQAAEVARQLGETAAAVEFNQLPACAPLAGPAFGCRQTVGPGTGYNLPRAGGCTYYVDTAAIPSVDPAYSVDAAVNPALRFRVDTAVEPHPSGNLPNTRLVTVWVCWQDGNGQVQEISTSRLVTEGL